MGDSVTETRQESFGVLTDLLVKPNFSVETSESQLASLAGGHAGEHGVSLVGS